MSEKLYTKKQLRDLSKKAVGLWRSHHNARLYRSKKYFGKWFDENILKLESNDDELRKELIKYTEFLFTEMNYTTETDYDAETQVDVYLEQKNEENEIGVI